MNTMVIASRSNEEKPTAFSLLHASNPIKLNVKAMWRSKGQKIYQFLMLLGSMWYRVGVLPLTDFFLILLMKFMHDNWCGEGTSILRRYKYISEKFEHH